MRAVDLIIKKRDGGALSGDELRWLIAGYVANEVPDYQMAAWAMAVLWRGMDDRETADLTLAMAASGDLLDLHHIAPLTVDKHSTGGVGDKTSLVLGPLCAALGLPVAKMSGRGLGFSGGTLDKLEAIPGMCVELSTAEFEAALGAVGLVIAGQSADLAPADRLLYGLRDVTGTVESIPLIAASIMSKKLAAGADCIVLDVKVGGGAFMKTVAQARALAARMVAIGTHAGRRVSARLTTMEQPLGYAIGNAIEVREAIATLRGDGPADLAVLCVELAAELLVLAERAPDLATARQQAQTALDDGLAWAQFRRFVAQQGGELAAIDDPNLLPTATVIEPVYALESGYIAAIDAEALGHLVNSLGGGRRTKTDVIDPAVGVVLAHKIGAWVAQGVPLATVHAQSGAEAERARAAIHAAITLSPDQVAAPPLFVE